MNNLTDFRLCKPKLLSTRDGEGLVAHMTVVLDKKQVEEHKRNSDLRVETDAVMKNTLQEAISSGQMGPIRVDPSYLLFEALLGNATRIFQFSSP